MLEKYIFYAAEDDTQLHYITEQQDKAIERHENLTYRFPNHKAQRILTQTASKSNYVAAV